MSLTKNGNRIGMAAHYERRDQLQRFEDLNNPNSVHWQWKLKEIMQVLILNDKHILIWDSETVPAKASYKRHYQFARAIVDGQLKIITRPGD